jgi:hypothetical protein
MVSERGIQIQRNMRTGIVSKILFGLGFLFLFIYVIFALLYQFTSFSTNELVMFWIQTGYNEILLAASILCIAAAFFFWFMHRQFSKLADIAEEIQQISELDENEE